MHVAKLGNIKIATRLKIPIQITPDHTKIAIASLVDSPGGNKGSGPAMKA